MLKLQDTSPDSAASRTAARMRIRRNDGGADAAEPDLPVMLESVRALIEADSLAICTVDKGQIGPIVANVGRGLDLDVPPLGVPSLGAAEAEISQWFPHTDNGGSASAIHVSIVELWPGARFVILCSPARPGVGGRRILQDRLTAGLPLLEFALRSWLRSRTKQMSDREQLAALDLLGHGMLIVDLDRRIRVSNNAARAILSKSNVISDRGGRLNIACLEEAIRFQLLLHHALLKPADSPAIATVSRSRNAPLMLVVHAIPMPVDELDLALVQLVDPTAEVTLPLECLSRHYGWTPVECRLIENLAMGKTLSEAASAMRLKEQTARTYLKHIFQKTGLRRQVEIVRLVLAGALPKAPLA
ncbi:MAG: hypothetical protein J7500_14275 [Sphingomonas sp.]|uniref:helix-turn-helix transcriptional regulator n=1 Tax=Sphingomonas sp. TaxID=28214 RepID=UPI001B00B0A1|nr:LuxR C-terminal-related transcriptional regulator [Sphingomonas sp.]MBO9623871.1 hypothetical protein [Sphingomonas sp.]